MNASHVLRIVMKVFILIHNKLDMKTLNDFLWWLSVSGMLDRYWPAIEYACWDKQILLSDFIKQMDANKPETLFDLPIRCGSNFFKEAKEKYISYLKNK